MFMHKNILYSQCMPYRLLFCVVCLLCVYAPLSAQEASVADESDDSSLETATARIVPVPPVLTNFQAGGLAGVSADFSKGSSEWNNFYDDFTLFIDYYDGIFAFGASAGITNQGKYAGEVGSIGEALRGHWFQLYEGVLALNFEKITVSGGYSAHSDIIDSPYSLFISSADIPAITFDFSYTGELFFATSRWVGLSLDSGLTNVDSNNDSAAVNLADRGLNYRTFGVAIGNSWRVGYQESIVYLDQYFSPIYFLAPVPYIFSALIAERVGSPLYSTTAVNPNIGIFVEYDSIPHYGYIQVLVDDVGVASTIKMAWSAGYEFASNVGRFGFYHAGATKNTFQAARIGESYPYTHSATNTYRRNTDAAILWYFDNYIGYLYGENTLSFRAEYENIFGIVSLQGGVEYVISGSKSPTNPWQEDSGPSGTFLLDDDRMEHTILLDADVTITVFEDVQVLFSGSLGYVFNQLELRAPSDSIFDQGNQIFTPGSVSRIIFAAFVGVQYTYNQHEPEWRKGANISQQRY